MNILKAYLKLIRPHQWVKNGFVLMPLFFGGYLLHPQSLLMGFIAFMSFSFAASSIYCFNDIYDVEDDRRHSVKCHRPVASGLISMPTAYALMAACALLSALCIFLLPKNRWQTGGVVLFYWLLNLAYCTKLKQIAIIDLCIISTGFVLRLFAGGFATNIVLSNWIILMTFLITLFMGLGKRLDDVLRMEQTGVVPRKNTTRYNISFINQAITMTATATLVCYIMYTVSPEVESRFHSPYLYITAIFVLLGLLRYMQLATVDKKSGDPTKVLLKDRFTQVVVLLWFVLFLLLIYIL